MIRKNINYKNAGYIFLFYDVNQKRVNKIFKICKKYLIHYQNSVFRGEITTKNLLKLKNELSQIIDEKEDFLSIIKLRSEKDVLEEIMGTEKNENNSIFI